MWGFGTRLIGNSVIQIQSTVELQRGGDGGHNLPNQTIEIGMYDIQVALTFGFITDDEGTVRVIQSHVADQEGIVGPHHGCGNLEDWQI